jgi:redox-sensitive bicupin YhaK (pirin superfamily)
MCAETYFVAGRGCAVALPEPQAGCSHTVTEHRLAPGEAWPVRIEAARDLLVVVIEGTLELMNNGASGVLTGRAMAHIAAGHAFRLGAIGTQPVRLMIYWLDPGTAARFCIPSTSRADTGPRNLLDPTSWPPPGPQSR